MKIYLRAFAIIALLGMSATSLASGICQLGNLDNSRIGYDVDIFGEDGQSQLATRTVTLSGALKTISDYVSHGLCILPTNPEPCMVKNGDVYIGNRFVDNFVFEKTTLNAIETIRNAGLCSK